MRPVILAALMIGAALAFGVYIGRCTAPRVVETEFVVVHVPTGHVSDGLHFPSAKGFAPEQRRVSF